jgi:glycosyltransferase involved in cell wall biosynthesis
VLGVVHHGNFSDAFEHPLTRRTAERLVRQIDGIVFLSDALAERCAPWIPAEKRFVVPNTIDDALLCTDAEVEAKQAKRGEARPLRLLFFSHMIRSKGYMDVLAAVARLHARGLAVHADFVGRWDAEEAQPAFERAVREHGLQDVVAHHGGLYDRDAAKALYLAADVFLLPTYYPTEAQPLTVIEALNAGTPVVVTPHASLPEMINEGAEGHFVPPSAPEAIAEAVERLADPKHWTHASERARVRFETMFSPDAVRSRWAAVLGDPAARNA